MSTDDVRSVMSNQEMAVLGSVRSSAELIGHVVDTVEHCAQLASGNGVLGAEVMTWAARALVVCEVVRAVIRLVEVVAPD